MSQEMRLPVNIAVTSKDEVVALCSDGTIWVSETNGFDGMKWVRLPSIPQKWEEKK